MFGGDSSHDFQARPQHERRADIPPLVAHFIDRYNKENRKQLRITPEAMKVLASCYWPGNVRELENCIERTATMIQGDTIRDLAFPCKQNKCLTQTLHFMEKADAVAVAQGRSDAGSVPDPGTRANTGTAPSPTVIGPTRGLPAKSSDERLMPEPVDERERLIWAMEQCGWVQAKAARLLKLTPRQLGYALQKNRIEVRKF